jgi:hypothetical protein
VGFVKFNDILEEKLKIPGFKEGLERADKKLKLELEFNEMLRKRGEDALFFVEVKDIEDY